MTDYVRLKPLAAPTPAEVRHALAEAGVTQAHAADLIHVDVRVVQWWCNDSCDWSIPGRIWDLLRARQALEQGDKQGALHIIQMHRLTSSR